jgi:N-acetylmuramoyl-L-alanine amidase
VALYPDAVFRPVTRYAPGGEQHVVSSGQNRLVFHTAVTREQSLFDFFNTPGNAVAHFFVAEDGSVEQYIDTAFQSSADLEGDHDIISVESWDDHRVRDWTPEQVEACAKLAAWCNKVHDIPLEQLPSSRPGLSGVGWHRLGIPPSPTGSFTEPAGQLLGGQVAGGETWTLSPGKLCPGDPKIRGVVDAIIPRAIEIANGDDMSAEDVKAINDHTDAAIKRVIEVINARAASERQALKDRVGGLRKAVERNASEHEVKELLDKLAQTIEDHESGRPGRETGDVRGDPPAGRV